MANLNININDGYKRYTINGDESRILTINTTDLNFATRVKEAEKAIKKRVADSKLEVIKETGEVVNATDDETLTEAESLEAYIREQVNFIFNDPNASNALFGNQSALSSVSGYPLYERAINAVIPEIEKDLKVEKNAALKRVNGYTKPAAKYKNKKKR